MDPGLFDSQASHDKHTESLRSQHAVLGQSVLPPEADSHLRPLAKTWAQQWTVESP